MDSLTNTADDFINLEALLYFKKLLLIKLQKLISIIILNRHYGKLTKN